MTKQQILTILKAHFIYSKTAEKIAKEIMELKEKPEIPNIPSVFFDRNPIQEPISERVKPGEEDNSYETMSEERKELLRSIPF